MVRTAEKAQEVRDLRAQLGAAQEDPGEPEIVFRESSPRKRMGTLYSMVNGEPLQVALEQIERVIEKRLPNGKYMFTANKEEAPEYKLGDVKCFLHEESPERAIVLELGLGAITCPAAHLANAHSKRIHGEHRHGQEWRAFQEHIKEAKERADIERQNMQLEATLALAGRASDNPLEQCPECNYTGTKQQMFGHKSKHKEAAHAQGN
jgi:hypothetical protein